MPLESVFFEFIDEGILMYDQHPKAIRNINWRLRLKIDLSKYPPEFTDLWAEFFSLLTNQGEMNSDKLMAAAQRMFEIEEYLKKTKPSNYNTFAVHSSHKGEFMASAPPFDNFSKQLLDSFFISKELLGSPFGKKTD